MAFAAGRPDNGVTRAYALKHIGELVAATDLPVNADFEAGFAATPRASTRARAWHRRGRRRLFHRGLYGRSQGAFLSLNESVERLRAARSAIDESGERVLLTARSEASGSATAAACRRRCGDWRPLPRRAPTCSSRRACGRARTIAAVVRVAGKLPVNVVVGAPGLTRAELEDLGVGRISTGAALARAAWGGFMRAARDIAEHGRFDAFAGIPASREIEAAFAAWTS